MQKGFVILLFQSTDDFLFRVKACLDVVGKIGKLNEGLFQEKDVILPSPSVENVQLGGWLPHTGLQ